MAGEHGIPRLAGRGGRNQMGGVGEGGAGFIELDEPDAGRARRRSAAAWQL